MAADFRIGKLFHLTPLVDDLAAAEFFFDTVFSPLCMMRNYSSHWHRDAAIYVVAEASIEPMQCYPPREGEEASSWFRYQDRFGPRVHNTAFYVIGTRAELLAKGVLVEDGHKDVPLFGTRSVAPARELPLQEFTSIDRTSIRQIPLPRADRKYRIVTRQNLAYLNPGSPKKGQVKGEIAIASPDKFWEASRYLIVVEQ